MRSLLSVIIIEKTALFAEKYSQFFKKKKSLGASCAEALSLSKSRQK